LQRGIMRPIKLLALDIDGTIVTDKKVLTPGVKNAIKAAAAKGCIITIITGRTRSEMIDIACELGITAPFATYNGAFIEDMNGKLWESSIPHKDVRAITDECLANGCMPVLFYEDGAVRIVDENNRDSGHPFYSKGDKRIRVDEAADLSVPKLILEHYRDSTRVDHILQWLGCTMGDRVTATRYDSNCLEVTHASTDKGKALVRICGMLGISPEYAMAIGDTQSDTRMIQAAGLGVCMANGDDMARAAADYICPSNEEDGAARAIEKFILNIDEGI